MQSLRLVVRQIGEPSPAQDVFSAQQVAEYIEYNYLSDGYRMQETHYLGEVKDPKGNLMGWKVMFVLVRDADTDSVSQKKEKVKDA